MRILTAAVLFLCLAPSAMARSFNPGGDGGADCDNRRRPNSSYCLYFGNPHYDAATRTFTGTINPYYDEATRTFSSLPPNGPIIVGPRRLRRYGP